METLHLYERRRGDWNRQTRCQPAMVFSALDLEPNRRSYLF